MRHGTCLLLIGCLATSAVADDDFDLSWHSVAAGGAVQSSGGNFELSGSIGQPQSGPRAGGDFEFNAGFWLALAATDCNADGTVDLADFTSFAACLAGPGAIDDAVCACFDTDESGFVDLRDFAAAQVVFSGR